MSKAFYKIHIELSDFCGLACSFCTPAKNRREPMPLPLFQHTLRECAPHTDIVALHLLGDPLTIPNLSEYLDLILKYNLKAEITTSGFYLGETERKILLHQAIHQINFSLTSYFDNKKRLSLEHYWSQITAFIEARRKNIKAKNQESNATQKMRKEPDSCSFVNLRIWNLEQDSRQTEMLLLLENYFETRINQQKKRQRLESHVILDIDSLFSWRDSTPHVNGFCMALKSHAGILSDGTIVPCCLDTKGDLALGNIKDGLATALASPRAKRIKAGFEQGICIEPFCQYCGYIKRFEKQNKL